MDDDSKKILLLKFVVGFLVFVAIMIFIIIILAIKNNNKRDELMETTTRRTLSGETTEIVTENSTSSNVTSETTTESTTTTVITQNTTSSKVNTTRGTTKSSGGGGSSYTPPTTSVIPSYSFTVISSGNASNYKDANNGMEWDLVNQINNSRSKKLKVASELRNAAERIAESCCNGGIGYCKEDSRNLFEKLGYQAYVVNIDASHYVNSYTSSMAFSTINSIGKKTIIESTNYNYMGVGVIQQSPLYNCVAVVVNE